MTCGLPLALAAMLAASQPETEEAHTRVVHRNAAILTAIGSTLAVSGGVVFGVGLHRQIEGTQIGGISLLTFGLSVLALGIFAWLWPGPRPPGWHASDS